MPYRSISAWDDPYDHGTGVASCAIGEKTGAGRCPANLVSAVCYPDPGTFPVPSFASFAADVIYWSLNEHNLRKLDGDPFNDASVLIFASSTATGPSAVLDLAIQRAFLGGMTVVVSAGNSNMDVLTTSPAGAVSGMHGDITLTVAASTAADLRWLNSNFGANVELFAPGENVLAASSTGVTVCHMVSGTSLSAGYVGGAAARILSRNPWATASEATGLLAGSDPVFGPSGPFGIPPHDVPKLLYVHPSEIPCVPLGYTRWMRIHGVDGDCPDGDLDCDGLTNAIEHFMALDPTRPVKRADRPSVGAVGGELQMRFRKADYICGEVRYEVQTSSDLDTWETVPDDAIEIVPDDGTACVVGATWLVAKVSADVARAYLRLKVLHTECPDVVHELDQP